MSEFRVTHLSDLHMTAGVGNSRTEPKLRGRLTGMNRAFGKICNELDVQSSDLVLITGDVTDLGDTPSWQCCDEILQSSGLKSRTLIIPGNHDVCGMGARFGWPGDFESDDLNRAKFGLQLLGQPVRFPWAKVVDPRVVVFGLDSNNAGNWTPADNAIGRLGDRQLSRFAELLAKHREVPVKIVALHHSPNIPEPETAVRRGQAPRSLLARWTVQMNVSDRRRLRELCISHRVRLILHGHLHEPEDRRVGGIRIVGAPATTEPIDQKERPRRYRFWQYTIHGKGGRVTRELVTV